MLQQHASDIQGLFKAKSRHTNDIEPGKKKSKRKTGKKRTSIGVDELNEFME